MNKYPSYQARMKELAQQKQKRGENFSLSLAAQLVLDESLFATQKKILDQRIDEALDQYDRKAFYECSSLVTKYRNN